MFSLGELFVKLGFNVDDAKLKSFNEDLAKTYQGVLKLSEAATVTTGVLAAFVQHAADSAVKLNNMVSLWGANAQGAQTYANALHQVNNAISVQQGQEHYRNFAELINASIVQGRGGSASGALSRLGVNWNENITPEAALKDIFDNYKAVLSRLDSNPEKARAIYSTLLRDVQLPDSQNLIADGYANEQKAAKYNIPDDWNNQLGKAAKSTAELSEAFTKFSTQIATVLSGPLVTAVTSLTTALNYLENFNEHHPAIAGAEGVAGSAAAGLGGWALLRKLFGRGATSGAAGGAAGGAGLVSYLPWVGLTALLYNSPVGDAVHSFFDEEEEGAKWIAGKIKGGDSSGTGPRGLRNNNPGNIKYGPFARNHGATGSDKGGFAIFPDYGSGESAISSLLGVYGHTGRDSIDSIVNSYTSGDSKRIQDNYKKALSGITGRGINDHLNMQDPATLARLVSGITRQENAGMTQNNTFNIKSDNPHEVARAVEGHLQTQMNRVYSQTNQGANY